ncbi:hypothetical protein F2Q70_00013143 [Brassica cretica]|uniref:Uncharacterized protein n=1 Tax=Brassica cretica TaxID=69181 RepID=A0A8S9M1X2_BRACR|nr:hypothetical protein F2Q70_00013143 [Brassica cretica]
MRRKQTILLDEEESGEDSRENRGRGRWEHCWRVRVNAPDRAPVVSVLLAPDQPIRPIVDMSASNAPRVFPSHGVTESITVPVPIAVYVNCVTPSHIVTRSGLVYVDVDVCINAPDRAPVVSVLLAPDQPIRPIVDMSASNAPRVFPSHGVTESITVALVGSELLLPLVSHKARLCIAEG